MAAPPKSGGPPVTEKSQLIAYLEEGCKPPANWRIGTEHEKFAFRVSNLAPLPYEGPDGIRAILEGMAERCDWTPVYEGENPIALTENACNITLEPGGQFELSGAPLVDLHETCAEVHRHLAEVKEVTEPLGVAMLGLGFQPRSPWQDVPWMPKGRYRIMRDYMPKKGKLGLQMMSASCTVQVNLDFASEADMVTKFRVGLALQPIATALFANSPFSAGKPNGWLSYRSQIWTDTDPDRCGMLPFVFEPGMGFERYVDYALDVPMYFLYRDESYIDVSGQSFRDFLAGRLPGRPGELPTLADWEGHLSTIFPEVRLKRYLEMRGADGGPWRSLCALPAFWVGLLYDREALAAAWDLCRDWSAEERQSLRDEVPRSALATPFRGRPLVETARRVLSIADAGLKRRAVMGRDEDERQYIAPLWERIERARTPAEDLLEAYHGRWEQSVDPLFVEEIY